MGIIYCVQNRINQKIYIGQSIRPLSDRIKEHKCETNKKIDNTYFHNALRKYGFNNFDWCILAEENIQNKLNEAETYWIDELETINEEYGYNLKEGGANGKATERAKKNMSIAQKGRSQDWRIGKPLPEETRHRISKALTGLKRSEEAKIKMSEAAKGKKHPWLEGKHLSKETKEKLRKANMGKKHTEESRMKMSKMRKGKKLKPWSEESKRKLSEAKKGTKATKETRMKMSLLRTGIKRTNATKEKMSNSAKETWADPEVRKKRHIAAIKRWANPEHKKKMSEIRINKNLTGIRSSMYGKKHTRESKELMSITSKKSWTDPIIKARRLKAQKRRWENYHNQKNLSLREVS